MNETPTIRYGGFWRRVAAKLIDFIILMPIMAPQWWGMSQPVKVYVPVYALSSTLTMAYVIWMNGRFGATLGKRVMKLKVLDVSGERIGYKQAFCREIILVAFAILMCVFLWLSAANLPAETTYLQMTFAKQLSPALNITMTAMMVWIYGDALFLLFNKKKRTVHDFIAETVVIRTSTTTNQVS